MYIACISHVLLFFVIELHVHVVVSILSYFFRLYYVCVVCDTSLLLVTYLCHLRQLIRGRCS
jgi:hypothetical protein